MAEYNESALSAIKETLSNDSALTDERVGIEGLSLLNPTLAIQGTNQDRKAFHLFRDCVAPQLSGYFDDWFWNTVILQAAHQEPIIRHAVLALSGLVQHMQLENRPRLSHDPSEGTFALQHCNTAIRLLKISTQKCRLSLDVCLVACLLFVYFEVTHRFQDSVPRQYHSQRNYSLSVDIILSLKEAHESFQYHVNQCIRLGQEIRTWPNPERLTEPRIYLEIFQQWQLSMQSFLNSAGSSLSPSAQQAAQVLQLNLHMLALEIDVTTRKDQVRSVIWQNSVPQLERLDPLAWDSHTDRFRQTVALARTVVDHSLILDRSGILGKFASDTNIVPTIYFLVYFCRHPAVRREAVALLHAMPDREGLWHSVVTARVSEKLIEIEEEGLGEVVSCEDVPVWARVRDVKVWFDMEGWIGLITFRRRKRPSEVGESEVEYEEAFRW